MKNSTQMLDFINQQSKNTLIEQLGIVFTEVGEDYLVATMPVCSKTLQPFGYLHGGASVALGETIGSYLSYLQVDATEFNVFGLEISANHIKAKRDGIVTGTAKLRHKGRTTHLVQIDIKDADNKLVSAIKMTNIIVKKQS